MTKKKFKCPPKPDLSHLDMWARGSFWAGIENLGGWYKWNEFLFSLGEDEVAKKRDYKKEYKKFQSSDEQKKNRAARNKNRREFEKEGKVHKGDGMDIDHKDSNPKNNSKGNLRVTSESSNTGKKEDSRKKGSKRKKR